MIINAKYRLRADPAEDAVKERKQRLSDDIKQKQKQVDNLKKTMPSRQNRMSVSPLNRNNTQQQINDKKGDIINLRRQKIQQH